LWAEEHPELFQVVLAKKNASIGARQLELIDTHSAAMFELTTRMVTLACILMGDVNIAVTTTLQTIHPTGREVALIL
jgi:hypothetical protein